MYEEIFRPIFAPDKFREGVARGDAGSGGRLSARGSASRGLIPLDAAKAIASHCDAGLFDPEELGRKERAQGNPVPPLVRVLEQNIASRRLGE
jgi:hypothetical protein